MKMEHWKTAAVSLLVATDLLGCIHLSNAFSIRPISYSSSTTVAKNRPTTKHYGLTSSSSSSSSNDLDQDHQGSGESSSSSSSLPRIIPTNGVPVYLYTDDVEPDALQQLVRLAESPLPVDHVSAMPDCHLGKGVTIGSVFASDKYISPMAVGVDIGCGMGAIPIPGLYKSDLTDSDKTRIQQLLKERIPTGKDFYASPLPGTKQIVNQIEGEVSPTNLLKNMLGTKEKRALRQLGTLGGGNHFLEVVYDEEDNGQVWIMLHSGSRGIGNQIATHYDKVAANLLKKQGVDTEALKGLNYMPIESKEGQDYLTDMEFCQRYAFENRKQMKKTMLDVVQEVTGRQADIESGINIHHNYCACEDCGNGRKLWVTRKGATSAKSGEYGIIPGSMGVGSYITRGKGNPMSWSSSSHGAGRRMSRTKAFENISQDEFETSMKGIVADTDPRVKDEAPQAYKDLTKVMKDQESLTEIEHHLLPLINVKGFENPRWKNKSKSEKEKRRERQVQELREGLQMAEASGNKRKVDRLKRRIEKIVGQVYNP